jgi:GNAT superfamily N-acetyltransferase
VAERLNAAVLKTVDGGNVVRGFESPPFRFGQVVTVVRTPLRPESWPGFVLQFIPVDVHPSARKHGIADADIEHATTHAMTIESQDDDTRLYLGPARDATLLEVVTITRDDGSELAIHAMAMRLKYQRLLPGD